MRSHNWLLVVLMVAAPLGAQRIRPGRALGYTHEAKLQMDSIARLARRMNKEPIGCVVRSAIVDEMYVLGSIGPAKNVLAADSSGVKTPPTPVGLDRYIGPDDVCEWWQPVIHAHVFGWLEMPSGADQRTTAMRDVFGFLLSVSKDSTWKLQSYP
jgi:hypothetical protein